MPHHTLPLVHWVHVCVHESLALLCRASQNGYYYLTSKYDTMEVKTNCIGWRFLAMLVSYFCYLNNGAFWCVVSLFVGPLSLRSVVGCRSYYPDKIIDRCAQFSCLLGLCCYLVSSAAPFRRCGRVVQPAWVVTCHPPVPMRCLCLCLCLVLSCFVLFCP